MDDLCPDALWGEEIGGAHVGYYSAPILRILLLERLHLSHAKIA